MTAPSTPLKNTIIQDALWSAIRTHDDGDPTSILSELIALGADPSLRNQMVETSTTTPFHLAAKMNRACWVPPFIAVGTNIHSRVGEGFTVAMDAISNGSTEFLLALLDSGLNSNSDDGRVHVSGDSLLHLVCEYDEPTMVEHLLMHGAALEYPNKAGWTPVHSARGSADCLRLLQRAGASFVTETRDGLNVAHLTAQYPDERASQALAFLSTLADIDLCAKGNQALSPLETAVLNPNLSGMARTLVVMQAARSALSEMMNNRPAPC